MSGVKIEKLVKRYGDLAVVDQVDIDVAEGEFLVLLGPSGCGKTTTLRCIAGLEDIDGGVIRIGDKVVSNSGESVPPERRQIGMVFQSYAVWPHLTVFENVAFPLTLLKRSQGEIKKKVDATLELVGLGGYSARGAHQLSGGQLQRVALARAVVAEPQVLLFDEPLSNLDAALRERMRFELRQLQQALGITSVYVTHDQQEAMVVADRIALMDGGQIVQIDSPTGLYNKPRSLFAAKFIGNANVLEGQVTARGETTKVRLKDGPELICSQAGPEVGSPVHVVFRTEQVRVSEGREPGTNCSEGKVMSNVFLGNMSDLTLALGSFELRSQLSPPVPWAADTNVAIEIPPEAIILLDLPAGRA